MNKEVEKLLRELIERVDKLMVVVSSQSEPNERMFKILSKAKFSQREIQRLTGKDHGDISKILRGKKKGGKKNAKKK